MSYVEIPPFIKKNHYLLVDGREKLVRDFSVASSKLILEIDNELVEYDPAHIAPLPAKRIPAWLKEGAAVTYNVKSEGRHTPTRVQQVFGMKAEGDRKTETYIALTAFAPMRFDGHKIRPRSEPK